MPMNAIGEDDLVARCRSGDAQAWNDLFDLHYAPTGRFIFQLSPEFTREDAEEICQEVFLSVIKHFGSFHGNSQLQTWIFRIAVNKARDYRERQMAAKRGGGQPHYSLQAELAGTGVSLDPPSSAPSPDNELLHSEEMALVRAALERLVEPCREIILLRYFGDLSYDEIARSLKLNHKTVSSRLSKCLDRLEMLARPMFGQLQEKWEKPASFPV